MSRSCSGLLFMCCGYSPSVQATIAISHIGPSGPVASFSSCWLFLRKPLLSAAFCGGPRITAGTTNTPIPSSTFIRRSCAVSFTRISAGSLCRATPRPTTTRIRDFARYPELRWLDRHAFSARDRARHPGLADRRLAGADRRLLLEHGGALARDLQHQLAGPRVRPAALRHRRPVPEQLVAGAADHGRGLAQQPSRLPGVGAAGLPLVGIRPDLLHPEGIVLGRPGLGPANAAESAGQRRATAGAPRDREGGRANLQHHSRSTPSPVRRLPRCRRTPSWTELQARALSARRQAEAFWTEIDLPQVPTLDDVRAYAKARLAKTPSLDEIAVCARQRLLELVYARLIVQASSGPG